MGDRGEVIADMKRTLIFVVISVVATAAVGDEWRETPDGVVRGLLDARMDYIFACFEDARDIETEPPPTAIADPDVEQPCIIDAIYFHNTLRCHTCKTIEETAKAVLEAEFSEEFAVGRMRWSAVNMERQPHYVEEYDLVKPTLILVRSVGGEQTDWVALDETWTLIRSELRFADYVENETRGFLEACP